ncbi:PhzF family phenazine biosynthesis protein [Kordiimonas sp. SCSIO 12610]|nr:PhzF family phenazine biosynthesis protein [Kordiimonas sp. SCSIO 12610]
MYQVDAFTDKPFGGNPAAVCPLVAFPSDELLQKIAIENNLSETAYLVRLDGDEADFHLRWFTPGTEVTLCGHATLASAHTVFNHLASELDQVRFQTLSGILTVDRAEHGFTMDFPAISCQLMETPSGLGTALGAEPAQVFKPDAIYEGADRDLLIVYPREQAVADLAPNMEALKAFAPYGFVCTAKADNPDIDFVSRCFFPNHGIGEDPVTGSAHSLSAPYWAQTLGKNRLQACQISARRGDLLLELKGDRLNITGQAVEVMQGTISL